MQRVRSFRRRAPVLSGRSRREAIEPVPDGEVQPTAGPCWSRRMAAEGSLQAFGTPASKQRGVAGPCRRVGRRSMTGPDPSETLVKVAFEQAPEPKGELGWAGWGGRSQTLQLRNILRPHGPATTEHGPTVPGRLCHWPSRADSRRRSRSISCNSLRSRLRSSAESA